MAQNLLLEYEWASVYLAHLKNTTDQLNKCPVVVNTTTSPTVGIANVTNYANISNLSVENWVYGNISSAEYYIRLFGFITTHNVTTCPTSTPFVLANSTNCSPCLAPTPIYDANTMTCVSGCPTGTTLNVTLRSCVSSVCPYVGQQFNATSKRCECASSTPYFTGSSCISCWAPSYWNHTSNQCLTCDIGKQEYFNPSTQKCAKCPSATPISIGITCTNCNQSSYYDLTTSSCVACPNNRLYNPVSQKC